MYAIKIGRNAVDLVYLRTINASRALSTRYGHAHLTAPVLYVRLVVAIKQRTLTSSKENIQRCFTSTQ